MEKVEIVFGKRYADFSKFLKKFAEFDLLRVNKKLKMW